jgi:RNA recognition motif-containing protein
MPYDEQKGTRISKPDAAERWLQRYEVDRRSIFIGGLPYGIDNMEDKLRDILGDLGDVVDVQVITRDSRDNRNPTVFAFAEFSRPDMASIAVDRLVSWLPSNLPEIS